MDNTSTIYRTPINDEEITDFPEQTTFNEDDMSVVEEDE